MRESLQKMRERVLAIRNRLKHSILTKIEARQTFNDLKNTEKRVNTKKSMLAKLLFKKDYDRKKKHERDNSHPIKPAAFLTGDLELIKSPRINDGQD